MEEDVFLIPEDVNEIKLAQKFKDYDSPIAEVAATVEEPTPLPQSNSEASASEEPIEYEGDFEKRLLVLYQGASLAEDTKGFLLKILQAVSHNLKDIALVSSSQISTLPPNCISHLGPHKVIVFGNLSHPIIQLKEHDYEIKSNEGTEYLFADDLGLIFGDDKLKRKLWTSLQAFFNIKK